MSFYGGKEFGVRTSPIIPFSPTYVKESIGKQEIPIGIPSFEGLTQSGTLPKVKETIEEIPSILEKYLKNVIYTDNPLDLIKVRLEYNKNPRLFSYNENINKIIEFMEKNKFLEILNFKNIRFVVEKITMKDLENNKETSYYYIRDSHNDESTAYFPIQVVSIEFMNYYARILEIIFRFANFVLL